MKRINVAALLLNCPKGMELDCTTWENVTFEKVVSDAIYIKRNNKAPSFDNIVVLNKYGCTTAHQDEKCRIFPKGKTTWEGFVPPCQFKDGDIIFSQYYDLKYIAIVKTIDNSNDIHVHCLYGYTDAVFATNEILGRLEESLETRLATEDEKERLFNAIKENGYRWDNETKTLVKLVEPKFKIEKGKWYVCIKDLFDNYSNKAFCKGDIYLSTQDGSLIPSNSNVPFEVVCASTYFRELLKFKVGDRIKPIGLDRHYIIKNIKNDRYILNDNKFLKITDENDFELVTDKFDISKLKPFESKVLVRNDINQLWIPAFWGYKRDNGYATTFGWSQYCIPFEGNEHLLNTANDCDNFFKVWEES